MFLDSMKDKSININVYNTRADKSLRPLKLHGRVLEVAGNMVLWAG